MCLIEGYRKRVISRLGKLVIFDDVQVELEEGRGVDAALSPSESGKIIN